MSVLVSASDLPELIGSRGAIPGRNILEGIHFGLANLTIIVGHTLPGERIPLHRHDYEEVFVVHGGRGMYTVGDVTVEAGAGDIVIVPAGVTHGFVNHTQDLLLHTAVHSSGTLVIAEST